MDGYSVGHNVVIFMKVYLLQLLLLCIVVDLTYSIMEKPGQTITNVFQ